MKLINLLYNPRIKRLISGNRKNGIIKWLNEFSVRYHLVYENRNYQFKENGEHFVLKTLQQITTLKTIFDVGANVGDWTHIASTLFPESKVFTFEISTQVFEQLSRNTLNLPNVSIHNVGLSDWQGESYVNFVSGNNALSSCLDSFSEEFHKFETKKEKSWVTTGDLFCSTHSIKSIDYLKIDVEGLESNVIKGFEKLLEKGAIRIIQFEYGYTSLNSRYFLKDFYELLNKYNMSIGKIYPTEVEFGEYNYFKEDFIGPNYLAVRNSENKIIEALIGTK